jgi:hypothetical protein
MRTLFCFLFSIFLSFAYAQVSGDYQSVTNGNWGTLSVWQTYNGTAWVAATVTPTSANANVITIQSGNTVTLNVASISIDQVIVNGTLQTTTTVALGGNFTVANGAGVDLLINGTFWDQLTNATITWAGTWQFGVSGTLLKTSASSSNNWQSSYNGGASTMPSTANWILRRLNNTTVPALSTTGAYYPNLNIENNGTANWVTSGASTFTGGGTQPVILGNLDIGGNGTNTVDFLNGNTNAGTVTVNGNVTIKTGCNMRNYGTGFEVDGNLVANGSITYDANDGRKIVFGGGNYQTVSGAGTLNVYDLIVNKTTGTLTLSRTVTVDNLMTFTNGIVNTTSTNLLIFASTASVINASNASFVNGPVRYMGTTGFVFPVGKNADYQAIAIGPYTATSGAFWTENFNNGCTSLCDAALYSGPNGAWTITLPSANGASANKFWVSCAENGNPVGSCGSACAGNATLHIGNVSTSPAAFLFCPSGDCGAAYDAGTTSGAVLTDKRAESPTINCTGKTGIIVSFKYMENGQGTTDNATLWYFDGSVWAQLADMSKTATGCAGGQGLWTAYSAALPSSADNNPLVKVGFRWVNNDDGVGNDPPFAVDDVTLGTSPEYFTAEYFYADPQVVYNNNLAATLSAISACEYWVLDRAPATSTAATTVQLTWDANSCPVIPLLTDTRVAHFDLTTWQDEGNGGNTGSITAGTVISAAPVTYFSPFTIGLIPPAPLPIELLGFSGNCSNTSVQLHWATASESNNDYFTIERSADGTNFTEIGRVDGAGNSDQTLEYSFSDLTRYPENNYYRLKQTDFNGQASYSKIIVVNAENCGDNIFSLDHAWINSGELHIDYSSGKNPVTIDVYSPDGKNMAHISGLATSSDYTLDCFSWSSGLYFIRVSDGYSSISKTVVK